MTEQSLLRQVHIKKVIASIKEGEVIVIIIITMKMMMMIIIIIIIMMMMMMMMMMIMVMMIIKLMIMTVIILHNVIYKDRIPEPKIQVNHLTRCAT